MESNLWKNISEKWKEREHPIWEDHWKNKGFRGWGDWRWSMVKMLQLDERTWHYETLSNPVEELRAMYCNRLTRWNDFCQDNEGTFGVLVPHPFFQNHSRVKDMRRNFPQSTELIALENRNRRIVVDGHHRAVAAAGMEPREFSNREVAMAVAPIPADMFEKILYSPVRAHTRL